MSKQLQHPMNENNFQQLVLVANAIAVFQMAIKLEPVGKRRGDYADVLKRLRRLESSIPGYLAPEVSLGQSKLFYDRMGSAVGKFMDSFKDARPVGRDKKGRFAKI